MTQTVKHEIDQHTRVYVVDKPNMLLGDESNHTYLVTDKSKQNYECTVVNGIQSAYNIIVFKNDDEGGEANTDSAVAIAAGKLHSLRTF